MTAVPNDDECEDGIFTDDELMRIVKATLQGSGRPLTVDEIERARDWAASALISKTLLDGVLAERILIHVPEDGGELRFWRDGTL